MISDDAYKTIMAFAGLALGSEWGPVRHRVELKQALDELERAQRRSKEATAAPAVPDPAHVQHLKDTVLVADAVQRHARIMLDNMHASRAPKPGDVWPSFHFTQAQWHLARITALQAVPVELAAAQLREETLTALDVNPKETPG